MNEIRTVIHGCGNRSAGFWVPRLLKQPQVRIVGLCDYNVALCEQMLTKQFASAKELPVVFENPRAMYEQLRPDAAVIVTAHSLHDEHCRMALDAGCHVTVEKPMTSTLEQAISLTQRVEEVGKVFQVAFNFPYSQCSSAIRKDITEGKYGVIQSIHASISQPWRSLHMGTWRMDPSLSGGGFMHDTGTHLIQAVLYLQPSAPVEVYASVNHLDCDVDINGAIQLRFEDDSVASLSFCGNGPPRCRIGVTFETGGLEFSSLHGHDAVVWDQESRDVPLPAFDRTIRHEHNFINAINGVEAVRSGAADGVLVCEVLEAAYASARLGKAVALESSLNKRARVHV